MFVVKNGKCALIRKELSSMSKDEYREKFNEIFRTIIREKDVTYLSLSNATGISFSTIANYGRGIAIPSLYHIQLIAEALELTVDDFTV